LGPTQAGRGAPQGRCRKLWETQQPHIRQERQLRIIRGAMMAAGVRELSLAIM